MVQNISFELGGLKLSEQIIGQTINTIFPGNDYLTTLVLIFMWFILGLVTLTFFFYFSKKREMFKKMTLLEKSVFSIFFGFISFMLVIFTYLPLIFLNYDILNFKTGSMLPFMILAGFLLYGCLVCASVIVKGRLFLIKTFKFLEAFFIFISMSFLVIVLVFLNKEYYLLIWFIVPILYFFYKFKPLVKSS